MAENTEKKDQDSYQPETTKKSTKEYYDDALNIFIAAKRTISDTVRISPIYFFGMFGTIFLISVMPFFSSWINSKVIDELVLIVTGGNPQVSPELSRWIVVSVLFLLFNGIIDTINQFFELNLYFDYTRYINETVTEKLSLLDIEYYEDPETNNLLQKVKENYGHRPQNFMTNFLWLTSSAIRIVSACIIIISFSKTLILLLFVVTIPSLINNIIFGRRNWGIWDAKAETKRDYWWSRDYLTRESALMELKIFKARNYILNRVNELFYNFQKEEIKIERKRSLTNLVLDIISAVGFGIIFIFLITAVLATKITIGGFSFYISSTRQLQDAFGTFFRRLSRVYEHGLYVVDIYKVLDLEKRIIPGEKILDVKLEPPEIKFKDVGFKYPGTEKYILKNFDLTIKPGTKIAIVGENGAGKTTLIKLLMRFYDVTKGDIFIDRINIKDLSFEDWYSKVGTLFQEFNTYHYDAKTNISIGNPLYLEDLERVIKSAKKSGAHEFIKEYEKGYDEVLSKAFGGIRPSWGQWQRIALARAFFKDAPILILDEPTSAIDPKAEFEIFEQLFEFAHDKTVIIISHRFSTVRNADRIIVLDKGKIVEDGSHQDLMNINGGIYKNAFELQRRGYE
ncbi:ABC transporter, ATP-binding/permease protein [sediment metagenome]|uniref:ABC transporter, ATP-binding/permease protein n=1 Tax=sediment metagenome TaxID=749907 RepID=D9PHK9_9ZZZZ